MGVATGEKEDAPVTNIHVARLALQASAMNMGSCYDARMMDRKESEICVKIAAAKVAQVLSYRADVISYQ